MGSIKNLGKGKFGLFAEAGKNPGTGKRHRLYRTFHGNITGARKELARLETELDQGTFQESTKMTVREYLKWWLEQHSLKLHDKTVESYKYIVDKHLSAMGAIPLDKLKAINIQSYVTTASKTLSPRSVRYDLTVLRLALKHAVKKWKLIKENPAEMIELPAQEKREPVIVTGEEMPILTMLARDRDYPIIATALYTGLRRGELLALRWSDVDGDKLHVRRSMQRIIGKGFQFKEPKTKAGQRTVDLPSSIVALLNEVQQKQAVFKEKLGEDYNDQGLVFCLHDGRPLDPHGLSRRFHKLIINAGFPNLRFHDLRHYENQKIMGNAC